MEAFDGDAFMESLHQHRVRIETEGRNPNDWMVLIPCAWYDSLQRWTSDHCFWGYSFPVPYMMLWGYRIQASHDVEGSVFLPSEGAALEMYQGMPLAHGVDQHLQNIAAHGVSVYFVPVSPLGNADDSAIPDTPLEEWNTKVDALLEECGRHEHGGGEQRRS